MFSSDITGPAGQAPLREWPGEVGVRRVAGGYHAQGPGGAAAAVDCGLGRDRGDAEDDRDRVQGCRGAEEGCVS